MGGSLPESKGMKFKQLEFGDLGRGGRREGAGRKRTGKAGVPHRSREAMSRRDPVLVTMKLAEGLWGLRNVHAYRQLVSCFAKAREKHGMRIVEFSVLNNHVHMIVEAEDSNALSRGMQALKVRLARSLNRLWQRTGTVWGDRFHSRVLKSRRGVWSALRYVLNNARKHRLDVPRGQAD